MANNNFILEDVFQINVVDPDGKKFDKVSRIQASGESHGFQMLLDINIELFPVKTGQKFSLLLAKSLSLEGDSATSNSEEAWRPDFGPSLADKYDYVMYGRVFKFEEIGNSSKMAVYVSYGGLLMKLDTEARVFAHISLGSNIYLLIKRF